jgi:hypothetical protein
VKVRPGDRVLWRHCDTVYTVVGPASVKWLVGEVWEFAMWNRESIWGSDWLKGRTLADTGEPVTGYTDEPLELPLLPLLAEVCGGA